MIQNYINHNWVIPAHIKKIVVDGANIAFASRINNKADISNLIILLSNLRLVQKKNPEIKFEVICDASLLYRITQRNRFERWVKSGTIKVCPGKIEADKYIIAFMQQFDGEIMLISNDQFRDHLEVSDLNYRMQYGYVMGFGEMNIKPLFYNVPETLTNILTESELIETYISEDNFA